MQCCTTLQAIGQHGLKGIRKALQARNQMKDKMQILTHCNTGSLATAEYGTALGVVRAIAEAGSLQRGYCTETRPYNQGQCSLRTSPGYRMLSMPADWITSNCVFHMCKCILPAAAASAVSLQGAEGSLLLAGRHNWLPFA